MNCREVHDRIEAYVDGVLAPDEGERVSAHLESCDMCRSEAAAERELRRRVERLETSIEPPEAVWRGIERVIIRNKVVRPRFGRRWATAAAVAASMVVAVVAGYTVGRQHGRMESAAGGLGRAAVTMSPAAIDVDAYEVARDSLLSALDNRRDSMSEETLRVVEANLEVIERAIVRMTAALSKDPNNPLLTYRLASAYRQQIELLQRATRLPAEI